MPASALRVGLVVIGLALFLLQLELSDGLDRLERAQFGNVTSPDAFT